MRRILIFFFLLGVVTSVDAQRIRQGNCAGASDGDRWYFTIYGGMGLAKYKFEPVTFITDKDWFESKTLFSYQAGATLHYRFERFNLGFGAAYHVMSGKMDEALLNEEDVSIRMPKLFASLEVPFYRDSFFDFGWGLNAGAVLPKGHYYNNPSMPLFFETGFYYNHILTSSTSLISKLYYGKSFFETTVNNAVSRQQTGDVSLQLGLRFWF